MRRAAAIARRSEEGRSLLEYLVVVVIVGVLTLLAVPAIKYATQSARDGKAKQNARTICNLYNGARSVGIVFPSPSKAGIANELFTGVSSQIANDALFQMEKLSGHDLVQALRYCRYEPLEDSMEFQPDGSEMLQVVVVQSGAGPGGIGKIEAADIVADTADDRVEETRWERLPTWYTADAEQSKRVLEYILNNSHMSEYGIRFGDKKWRSTQGENGLWWAEFGSW
ncbi:MAG: type II secretory pathway pseudopilin PulG [Verrucomicrobiales bacterium]